MKISRLAFDVTEYTTELTTVLNATTHDALQQPSDPRLELEGWEHSLVQGEQTARENLEA
jgi:hypothetical protein